MECNIIVLGECDLSFVSKVLHSSGYKRIYTKSVSPNP